MDPDLSMNQRKGKSRQFWPQMFRQAGAILLLATILGAMINFFREEGLSLTKKWPSLSLSPEGSESIDELSFEEARELFLSDTAFFLDARSQSAYRDGHIEGAFNLPWESFELMAEEVLANIPPDVMVITYCDGKECDLSMNLAKELVSRGYESVRVFVNGWGLWKEADLPITQGETR